jgi:hypothetical protein
MFDNHDKVIVTLATANTHITAMKAIAGAISSPARPQLIVIANDDSGGTDYLENSGISACGGITVQAAYGN